MLAALLLLYLWVDADPPLELASTTLAVLGAYAGFALLILAMTWNNWWLEARLAGPAHAVDIVVFALLVYSTGRYDSPYFTFFIFILLASAIRWGLRATSLTAVLLVSLYYMVGMLVAQSGQPSEFHDFVDRTGHLAILSMILVWFGVNQWRSAFPHTNDRQFHRCGGRRVSRLKRACGPRWNGSARRPGCWSGASKAARMPMPSSHEATSLPSFASRVAR